MDNYFTDRELRCRCCGAIHMDPYFLQALNLAREFAGFPFIVTSGYRCGKHNIEVGSTSDNHTSGCAADLKCESGTMRFLMVKALIRARMTGIGIGKDFIHGDTRHELGTMWLY